MGNLGIKINYLYNSSFKVETEKSILIFDYYYDSVDGENKCSSKGVIGKEDLETDKAIIVFCSHSHGDHFNEIIFTWKDINPNIKYILSSDIVVDNKLYDINIISPYEQLKFANTYIKAFGSTDLGVSFLVKVDGVTIFHAGDLNWWYWYDESDEDNQSMERDFKAEIERLKGEVVDIAFFPVDSRLRDSYALGADYFIDRIGPKVLVPMHFREDFAITRKFAEKNRLGKAKVVEIRYRGEEFSL